MELNVKLVRLESENKLLRFQLNEQEIMIQKLNQSLDKY